jgi:hypothetical protein
MVADPHHFNADPYPCFYFNADPDPTFRFIADPDPTSHESDNICDHWSTDPPWLHFETIRLHCERPRPAMDLFLASTAPEF